MTQKLIGVGIIAVAVLFATQLSHLFDHAPSFEKVQAISSVPETKLPPVVTQSVFEEKIATKTATLDRKTIYKDDPEREIDTEEVLEEGRDGKVITTLKITYYEGEKYDEQVLNTQTIPAEDKVIARGTKIIWRDIDTPDGTIHYWKKLRVWATQYDSHCLGCNEWTAIGMRAGKGVVAVDPSVIKLRSHLYIPGYGKAVAGDVGGAVNGKMIDLGFDDTKTSGWSSHFVEVYLLD